MKIKDILDMETYLAERCYCPNEIYSSDGFFYQLFYADSECEIIGENDYYAIILTKPNSSEEKDKVQILAIFKNKEKTSVVDATRFDATENNILIFKKYLSGIGFDELSKQGYKFNEYTEGSTAKALSQIFAIADAIIID